MPKQSQESSSTSKAPRKRTSKAPPAMEAQPAQADGLNTVETRQPTHDEIAQRAYLLWAERGYRDGDPDNDWFTAEQQLRQRAS